MIPVYDEDHEVIGEVEYNSNLDYWDGRNHTCGSTGRHKGLTRLTDGRYVLINGTQWQGERDTANVISEREACQEILRSGNTDLFESFPELKKYKEESMVQEDTGWQDDSKKS